MDKIDFVIIWVDGNDPSWQDSYKKYRPKQENEGAGVIRFRDWDNLKYWFRGVEKFAPWVNKIYFVTCGHYPEWLNKEAPKLCCIKHEDYMPTELLPTFSSHPIELNLHRIKGLSDRFVYFNDDTFITRPIAPERFFRDGLPCDMAICETFYPQKGMMPHILLNNIACINRHFKKKEVLKKNRKKWLTLAYGAKLVNTLRMLPHRQFSAFFDPHLPNSYLKQTFEEVWEVFDDELTSTSHTRFRSVNDVNQYLFRYWQLVSGNFSPMNTSKDAKFYEVAEDTIDDIENHIRQQDVEMLVLNDSAKIEHFDELKRRVCEAFEEILPQKSSFEL